MTSAYTFVHLSADAQLTSAQNFPNFACGLWWVTPFALRWDTPYRATINSFFFVYPSITWKSFLFEILKIHVFNTLTSTSVEIYISPCNSYTVTAILFRLIMLSFLSRQFYYMSIIIFLFLLCQYYRRYSMFHVFFWCRWNRSCECPQ